MEIVNSKWKMESWVADDLPRDGVVKAALADGKIDVRELENFEKQINADNKISCDEMRYFAGLIHYSTGADGKTRFTPDALEYIDKHFMNVKEKAQNETLAVKSLLYSGSAIFTIGLFTVAAPPSMVPYYLGGLGVSLILTALLLARDGNVDASSRFDSQGRLMII